MATCELLSATCLPEPVHGVAFNPWDAGELACVGQCAVTLWLLRGPNASLQVPGCGACPRGWGLAGALDVADPCRPCVPQGRREPLPEELGAGELTSLCYGAAPLLYCGSNAGQVCVWDTSASRCFLAWEADDGEIGGCLAGPPRPDGPGLASPGRLGSSWGCRGSGSCRLPPPGVLLCSGTRLVSGSNTRRLRLWAVGAVPELRCKDSRAR